MVGYEKGNVKLQTQTPTKSLAYWEQTLIDKTGRLEIANRLVTSAENSISNAVKALEKYQGKLDALADDASDQFRIEYERLIAENLETQEKLKAELA